MDITPAPGWTADWLNGWLAAIGTTIVAPDIRVAFDRHGTAELHHPGGTHAAELIAAGLPTPDDLDALPCATQPQGQESRRAKQKYSPEEWSDAARRARATADLSLSSLGTDLGAEDFDKAAFNAVAPGTCSPFKGAFDCLVHVAGPADPEEVVASVAQSMDGTLGRMEGNGLSFDIRRIASGVNEGEKAVDPVVELLAWAALQIFPARGNGRVSSTRGWDGPPSRSESFTWPMWPAPLDRWGIDALLDRHHHALLGRHRGAAQSPLHLHGSYTLEPHRPAGTSDTTRGYGTRPA